MILRRLAQHDDASATARSDRGPRLLLEYVVKAQAGETAAFFGFHDRGRLQPGLKADVNVIDFDGTASCAADDLSTCRSADDARSNTSTATT